MSAVTSCRLGVLVQQLSGVKENHGCGPCTCDCPKDHCAKGCEKGFGVMTRRACTAAWEFFDAYTEVETTALTPPFEHPQRVVHDGTTWIFNRYHRTHRCVTARVPLRAPFATLTPIPPRSPPPAPARVGGSLARYCRLLSEDGKLEKLGVRESELKVKRYDIDNASVVEAARRAGLLRCGSKAGMLKHGVPELVFRHRQYRRQLEFHCAPE